MQKKVSKVLLARLPRYLECLKQPEMETQTYVSAPKLAAALGLGEVLVRKDLAMVSDKGRPWVGYQRQALIADLERFLGYDVPMRAVLVGAGRLGMALLHNRDLEIYGVRILAAFDEKPCGRETDTGIPLCAMDELPWFCERYKITMGIIAVPERSAQEVCDRLIRAGVRAIWNFTSAYLTVPEGIHMQNENIKTSLTALRLQLQLQES